jgi:hypothetical protein
VQRLAAAASVRRGATVSAEEAASYLDMADGDVTAALLELCADAEWESSRRVARAYRPAGCAAPPPASPAPLPVSSAAGGFGFAGSSGGGGGLGGGLRARFSAVASAAGGGGEKRD